MESRWKGEQERMSSVRLQDVFLNKVEYKYLGAYVEEGGELDREIEKKGKQDCVSGERLVQFCVTSGCR